MKKDILATFLSRKGQFAGFLWNRPLKTRKEFSHLSITKSVRCVAQVGVDYDNRASVQAARESGELPSENAGLPWGQWKVFPYVITHKGNDYLRIYPVANRVPRVVYRCNGAMVSREFAESVCLASEFRETTAPHTCFTVNAANVLAIR